MFCVVSFCLVFLLLMLCVCLYVHSAITLVCICGCVCEKEREETVCVSARIDFLSLSLSSPAIVFFTVWLAYTLCWMLVRELGCLAVCQLSSRGFALCVFELQLHKRPCFFVKPLSASWCDSLRIQCLGVVFHPVCDFSSLLSKLRGSNSASCGLWCPVRIAYFGWRVENLELVQLTVCLCSSPAFKGWSSLFSNQRSGFLSVIILPADMHCHGETYRLVKPVILDGFSLPVKPFSAVWMALSSLKFKKMGCLGYFKIQQKWLL